MKTQKIPLILFLTFLFFVLIDFSACEKDSPSLDDPCSGVVETTADFGFYLQRSYKGDKFYISIRDTFYNDLNGTKLFFKALKGMDAYEWTVGSDPSTFTDSVFFLNFYGIEGDITVTLKTYLDQPDVTCFPQDTGFAKVSKSIYMKPGIHELEGWPIFGLFEGADEDAPEDIYTVDFMPFFNNYLKNFPYGCERTGGIATHLTTPRTFTLFGQDYNIHDCWDPKGEGYLLDGDNNTLVIEYSMEDPSDPTKRINKKFVGTRVE